MTEADHDRHKGWSTSALAPALIGAVVGLLGVALGAFVALQQTGVQQVIADRDNGLKVAEVKRQIILAAGDFDKPTLEALLEHTLRPIDPTGFEAFRRSMMDLVAAKAASNDPRAATLETESAATVPPLESKDPRQLVMLFGGPDRLRASNRLVDLYDSRPTEIINALIGALVPESPLNKSYTINLYVAFTLGRLRPSWRGTERQLHTVERLKEYRSYRDPTFKLRVDQALGNFRS